MFPKLKNPEIWINVLRFLGFPHVSRFSQLCRFCYYISEIDKVWNHLYWQYFGETLDGTEQYLHQTQKHFLSKNQSNNSVETNSKQITDSTLNAITINTDFDPQMSDPATKSKHSMKTRFRWKKLGILKVCPFSSLSLSSLFLSSMRREKKPWNIHCPIILKKTGFRRDRCG
jgi:hypothetical protein